MNPETKKKIWWVIIGVVFVVLIGVNIYLFLLRKSIVEFIRHETGADNQRIEQIRGFRQ